MFEKKILNRKNMLTETEKAARKLESEIKRRDHAKRTLDNMKRKAVNKILNVIFPRKLFKNIGRW